MKQSEFLRAYNQNETYKNTSLFHAPLGIWELRLCKVNMYHKEKVDNMPILVIKTNIVSHYQHLRSEFFGVIVDGMG